MFQSFSHQQKLWRKYPSHLPQQHHLYRVLVAVKTKGNKNILIERMGLWNGKRWGTNNATEPIEGNVLCFVETHDPENLTLSQEEVWFGKNVYEAVEKGERYIRERATGFAELTESTRESMYYIYEALDQLLQETPALLEI